MVVLYVSKCLYYVPYIVNSGMCVIKNWATYINNINIDTFDNKSKTGLKWFRIS